MTISVWVFAHKDMLGARFWQEQIYNIHFLFSDNNINTTSFDEFLISSLGIACLAIMFLMQKNLRRLQIRGKSIFRLHASYFCQHNIRWMFYFFFVFLIFNITKVDILGPDCSHITFELKYVLISNFGAKNLGSSDWP